uniref:hypothetical protein n=1 Tax=Enterobacter cloacae TaxID=550 RepID=UPI00254FD196
MFWKKKQPEIIPEVKPVQKCEKQQRAKTTPSSTRNGHAFNKHPVSYTHLRAHETSQDLSCRLLLEK